MATTVSEPAGRKSSAVTGQATRWLVRLVVPVAIFGHLHRYAYLDPRHAAQMMVGGDWTTYVVSPNFLDTAHLLPVGSLPGYLAPVGASLAKTDSIPAVVLLYRIVASIFSGHPVQLIGIFLLSAIALSFVSICRFLDLIEAPRGLAREVVTLCLASTLVMAPFWNLQYVHPALMQQWILVLAVTSALRRCPTFIGGRFRQNKSRLTGVAPVLLAAACQPYLLPMTMVVSFAPDIARVLRAPAAVLLKIGGTSIGALGLASALGYIGGGGKLGSTGFGAYAANLVSLVDADGQSRILSDIPTAPDAIGGYSYVGFGGLVIVVLALSWSFTRFRSTKSKLAVEEVAPDRVADVWPQRVFTLGVFFLLVYAVVPDLWIGKRRVLSLQALFEAAAPITAIFRVNGRFTWIPLWTVLLLGGARLVLLRSKAPAMLAAVLIFGLQVYDVVPWTPLVRPAASIEYPIARAVLQQEAEAGAVAVQFQPPVVIPGCFAPDFGDFPALGDAILAASQARLSVNSGYVARLTPAYEDAICNRQAAEFRSGRYVANVVYVIPGTAATPSGLRCRPLTTHLQACRVIP
jgi:hypothetical protein